MVKSWHGNITYFFRHLWVNHIQSEIAEIFYINYNMLIPRAILTSYFFYFAESLVSSADFDIIRKRYLWCAVPQCRSSSRRNPNKMFVCVPFKSRLKWFQLARINTNQVYIKSRIYFCEDHFNVSNILFIKFHK